MVAQPQGLCNCGSLPGRAIEKSFQVAFGAAKPPRLLPSRVAVRQRAKITDRAGATRAPDIATAMRCLIGSLGVRSYNDYAKKRLRVGKGLILYAV